MKGGRLVATLRLLSAFPRAIRMKARAFPSLALRILLVATFVTPVREGTP
jgi:hypothetical protein